MMRPYASFLIRCWRLSDGEQRFKVEQIQSGEVTQAETLEQTLAWLADRLDEPVAGYAGDGEARDDGYGGHPWPTDFDGPDP